MTPPQELTDEQKVQAATAGRQLLRYALAKNLPSISEVAIQVVGRTAGVAPQESTQLLRDCLTPERVAGSGHSDLPAIARCLAELADADEAFVIDFVRTLCSAEASPDDWEPFGGRILRMRISKRDLLHMAHYELEKHFKQIMQRHPSLGARILILVLDSHIRKRCPANSQPPQSIAFDFRGRQAQLVHDGSELWAFDRPSVQHELWYKLCTSFRTAVRQFCGQGALGQVYAILDTFAEHATSAVLWNQLLLAAMEVPQVLGPLLAELLYAPAILQAAETSVAAGRVLEQAYPHLDSSARQRIEGAIMALPSGLPEESDAERRRRIRDRLIGCIPRNLLATQEARNRRNELDAAGGPPENQPLVRSGEVRFISDDEHLKLQGVDLELPQNAKFRAAQEIVKQFQQQQLDRVPALDEIRQFLPDLRRFEELVTTAEENSVDPLLRKDAEFHVYSCCEVISRCPQLASDQETYAYVREKLLKGASHPVPEYRQEDEEQWDKPLAAWGSPLPRVDAAQGLMNLAARLESHDDQILDAIKKLASDPVPAVRHMIASALLCLWHIDQVLFWKLAEHFSSEERRIAVLQFFVQRVLLELPHDLADRVQPLMTAIHERMLAHPNGAPVREECTVFFLRRALWDKHEDSLDFIREAFENPADRHPELQTIVRLAGELLVFEKSDRSEDENRRIRQQAIQWLVQAFRSIGNAVAPLLEQLRSSEPPPGTAEQVRQLVSVQEHVVHRVLSVSEALKSHSGQQAPPEDGVMGGAECVSARFVQEAEDLLEVLCDCRFAHLAYDVLKTLNNLRAAEPKRIFRLIAKVTESAKKDAFQYESLAADKVVEIVETYLAEHRGIFRDDPGLLCSLMDLLDLFVEPGWPKAAALVYRLDEVFRG